MQKNVELAQYTTLKMGGKAKYFFEIRTKKDLEEAFEFIRKNRINFAILGGGSNVLFSDEGFDGAVLRMSNRNLSHSNKKSTVIYQGGAGYSWDKLVKKTVDENLQGIECLSGIPGTLGAAPVQNIGAYGQELKDVFEEVLVYDIKKRQFTKLTKKECRFGYRDSTFKSKKNKNRFIIWEVKIRLKKNSPSDIRYESLRKYLLEKNVLSPTIKQAREAVLALRKQNHIDPVLTGNAGSFFKNPLVKYKNLIRLQKLYPDIPYFDSGEQKYKLFAGWIIDKCGWKGKNYKNVGVSPKHALVLVNRTGNGKASEIMELADKIVNDVQKRFDISLEKEVQYIL